MEHITKIPKSSIEPRIKSAPSITRRINLVCGHMYVTVSFNNEKIYEVFINMGKTGQCLASCLNGLAVVLSLAIRSGVDPNLFIAYLEDIKCPSVSIDDGVTYFSCVDAVAKFMKEAQVLIKEEKS